MPVAYKAVYLPITLSLFTLSCSQAHRRPVVTNVHSSKGAFRPFWSSQERTRGSDFAVSSMDNMEVHQSLKWEAMAANTQKRAEVSRKSMWTSRVTLGHGTGWQATKGEVCTEIRRVSLMWKCGGSGARKAAQLAMK
jgi:hypothetical protein